MTTRLHQLQHNIDLRTATMAASHGAWPCRKGCSECCQRLASEPRLTEAEWNRIAAALDQLPPIKAAQLRDRIRETTGQSRPIVCPLLDAASGECQIYEARPLACRAYGFYAERGEVLGCGEIEALARRSDDVIWGNHEALKTRQEELGPVRELSAWLAGAVTAK